VIESEQLEPLPTQKLVNFVQLNFNINPACGLHFQKGMHKMNKNFVEEGREVAIFMLAEVASGNTTPLTLNTEAIVELAELILNLVNLVESNSDGIPS
jgi:hypothetical protein